LDLQLPIQLVPITTNVVSLKPTQVIHYVIEFANDLRQVGDFSDTSVSSTNNTDRHDIAEICLKVALNTIKQTNKQTNKQTITNRELTMSEAYSRQMNL